MTPKKRERAIEVDDDAPFLPHNIEAEKALLGAILIDNRQFDVVSGMGVDDLTFFRAAHSRIWEAMGALSESGAGIDLVTLKDELARSGELEQCGGPAYIASLTDGVPRASNCDYYADILKDLRIKRSLISYAKRLIDSVRTSGLHGREILANADTGLLTLAGGGERTAVKSAHDLANEHFGVLDRRQANKGQLIGLETGFPSVNEVTLGWQRGDLCIVAARPSIGKSAFIMNSAMSMATAGHKVAVFSLEMTAQQLTDRMISSLSDIELTRILNGNIRENEHTLLGKAMTTISNMPLYVDDTPRRTVGGIRRECRRMMAEHGLDAAIIDYVQLVRGSVDRRGANRTEELDDISNRLKELARELRIPVIALSQLNRKNQDRADPRPVMSDLRQSGSLEQDADLIAFLHRENHKQGGATEFILEKQRMGPCGTLMLNFIRDVTTFVDAPELTEKRKAAEAEPADPPPTRRRKKNWPPSAPAAQKPMGF